MSYSRTQAGGAGRPVEEARGECEQVEQGAIKMQMRHSISMGRRLARLARVAPRAEAEGRLGAKENKGAGTTAVAHRPKSMLPFNKPRHSLLAAASPRPARPWAPWACLGPAWAEPPPPRPLRPRPAALSADLGPSRGRHSSKYANGPHPPLGMEGSKPSLDWLQASGLRSELRQNTAKLNY